MDFGMEYLNIFLKDDNYEKAELLWLWYDFHTEMFDRGLWSLYPSKYDDTMVMIADPKARILSNENAEIIKFRITKVARHFNLSEQVLMEAKNSDHRCRAKMGTRIEEYTELDKIGKFNFIKELI